MPKELVQIGLLAYDWLKYFVTKYKFFAKQVAVFIQFITNSKRCCILIGSLYNLFNLDFYHAIIGKIPIISSDNL